MTSETSELMGDSEIHYILGDQQFILNQDNQQLTDVICPDGSRAILLDGGQYLIADNNQSILFQQDTTDLSTNLTQYYIDDSFASDGFIVDGNVSSNLFENTEIVQLIDNTENAINDGQIIYLTTTNDTLPFNFITNEEKSEIEDVPLLKKIKLEHEFLEFGEETQNSISNVENNFQCVMENGEMCNLNIDDTVNEEIDIAKKTGNGQIVTVNNNDDEKNRNLNNLLDKKISIGKTKSGKRIIGKIIHVENRNETKNDEEIIVKKCLLTKDGFCEISKTLCGLMEMNFVRKKLENKNVVVKLIEKKYFGLNHNQYNKTISYSYGYMKKEMEINGGEMWKFIPDQNTQEVLLNGQNSNKVAKFPITTSLTIVVNYPCKMSDKSKTIRVNLNPAPGNLCTICAQYFKTSPQLRHHMTSVHSTDGGQILKQQHKSINVDNGELFICSKCSKCFTSQHRLQRHFTTHNFYLNPLECSVCNKRCTNEWSLKKHLLMHTAGIKPFPCDVCKQKFSTQYDVALHKKIHFINKNFMCDICSRAFTRHSNLLRHMEIHKGALYKCDICFCTYNYMSSLTRHMVENHIIAEEIKNNVEEK